MKKTFLILGLFFLIFSFKSNKNIEKQDIEELKNLIQESFDSIWSIKGVSLEKIERYHTKDFIILEHGEIWNNKKIENVLSNKKEEIKRINSFYYKKFKIEGNRAWIAYYNNGKFYNNEKLIRELKWLESINAIRTKDGWKLEMMHSTRVKYDK